MTSEPQPANEAVSAWEEPVVEARFDDEDALIVDVAGYEGPLDLLLALARTQKVDISKISVLALADQYLGFIGEAQKLRLELAADYLVMAAWLAYLKSRLLLPREAVKGDEATAEELARRLSFRLMRLDAMREAAAQLMTRMRLGRDVFARGMPEGTKTIRETEFTAKIYDLLHAYADQRRRTIKVGHVVKVRPVWSIKDARMRLERLLGEAPSASDWMAFEYCLQELSGAHENGRTVMASSFGATLEMAREGKYRAAPGRPVRAHLHAAAQVRVGPARCGMAESRLVGETRVRPGQPMTKEKRMEPPRLSLVPSSQDSNDNGREDAGDEPVRAAALPRNVAALPFADHREKLRILEALLFAASEPLDEAKLASHLTQGEDIGALIEELRAFYAGRGVNLVRVAGKWAFRTAEDLSYLLERYATQERRLSKAALETLSIIAYHQPVTRAEIEEIRGVTTSAGTLDILLETGWVRLRGRRRAPGRPVTYGTTDAFLSHFGLEGIKDLPGLAELRASGLLDGNLPPDFTVPDPTDVAALMPDELPLEAGEDEEDEALDDRRGRRGRGSLARGRGAR